MPELNHQHSADQKEVARDSPLTKLNRIAKKEMPELNHQRRTAWIEVARDSQQTKLNKDAEQRDSGLNLPSRAAKPQASRERPQTKLNTDAELRGLTTLNSSSSATVHTMLDSAPLYRGLSEGTLVFQP